MNNINIIKKDDIFSEMSHYTVVDKQGSNVLLKHLESNSHVTLSNSYISGLLVSADQFTEEKEVTKEDKKDGTWGIRSIWEHIHGKNCFTVVFRKQDEPLSGKKLKQLQEEQVSIAVAEIEATAKAKKGVADKAKEVLARIQANPILPYTEGELRTLRGYKIDFESRDGKYRCIDMDLVKEDGNTDSAIRPVNINTIQSLIYEGIKYIVK